MLISITRYVMNTTIDNRLRYEIGKIVSTLDIQDSTISLISFSELAEPDFKTITKTPYFLQLYNLSGDILISSDNLQNYKKIPIDTVTDYSNYSFGYITVGDDKLRVGYFPLYNSGGRKVAIVQLATFETELQEMMDQIIHFNLIILPAIIIIILIASFLIGKKSLYPINKIIETAKQISAKSLTSRIEYPAHPNDELGRLRDTLNGLFDRIESYVNQLSQFTDHASHQLMNPLTAMKTELEYILKKSRSTEEYRYSLEQLLNQTDHMVKIVKTLLLLSKQDKKSEESKSIFNLSKFIKTNIPAKINSHSIKLNIQGNIYSKGDSDKFAMVIENLVDNAVKYSPNNKEVNVTLRQNGDNIELIVADNGIGINNLDKKRIFDRFYRSGDSEKIGIKGYGLGLSLVKTILDEMEAEIKVENNEPSGSKFIIVLKAIKFE